MISLALSLAVACAHALVQLCTVVVRMVVVVAGVAAVEGKGVGKAIAYVDAEQEQLAYESLLRSSPELGITDDEREEWELSEEVPALALPERQDELGGLEDPPDLELPDVSAPTKAEAEDHKQVGYLVPEPFVTPSANHESRASYDGVGEKVADFVKRFKDMQAELTETKQRLAVAEDYKSKYEELKTEMDEILGNQ